MPADPLGPMRDWSVALGQIMKSQREFGSMIGAQFKAPLHDPQLQWQATFLKTLSDNWRRQLEGVVGSLRPVSLDTSGLLALKGVLERQGDWQAAIREQFASVQLQLDQLGKLLKTLDTTPMAVTDDSLRKLYERLGTLNLEEVHLDASGSVTVDDETIGADEMLSEVESLAEELKLASSLPDLITRLVSLLERAKKPLAQFLMVVVVPYVISIVANITTPIYERWWEDIRGGSKAEMALQVRQVALDRYDVSQLGDYRFVSAKQLRVRSSSNPEAYLPVVLPFGKVVRIIGQEGRWKLVEFSVDDDAVREGWVPSCYLAKFVP